MLNATLNGLIYQPTASQGVFINSGADRNLLGIEGQDKSFVATEDGLQIALEGDAAN